MIIEIKDVPENVKKISIDRIVIEMHDGSTSSVDIYSEQTEQNSQVKDKLENEEQILTSVQDDTIIEDIQNEPIPDEMLDLEF